MAPQPKGCCDFYYNGYFDFGAENVHNFVCKV